MMLQTIAVFCFLGSCGETRGPQEAVRPGPQLLALLYEHKPPVHATLDEVRLQLGAAIWRDRVVLFRPPGQPTLQAGEVSWEAIRGLEHAIRQSDLWHVPKTRHVREMRHLRETRRIRERMPFQSLTVFIDGYERTLHWDGSPAGTDSDAPQLIKTFKNLMSLVDEALPSSSRKVDEHDRLDQIQKCVRSDARRQLAQILSTPRAQGNLIGLYCHLRAPEIAGYVDEEGWTYDGEELRGTIEIANNGEHPKSFLPPVSKWHHGPQVRTYRVRRSRQFFWWRGVAITLGWPRGELPADIQELHPGDRRRYAISVLVPETLPGDVQISVGVELPLIGCGPRRATLSSTSIKWSRLPGKGERPSGKTSSICSECGRPIAEPDE